MVVTARFGATLFRLGGFEIIGQAFDLPAAIAFDKHPTVAGRRHFTADARGCRHNRAVARRGEWQAQAGRQRRERLGKTVRT
jgi:hypothetical protein